MFLTTRQLAAPTVAAFGGHGGRPLLWVILALVVIAIIVGVRVLRSRARR